MVSVACVAKTFSPLLVSVRLVESGRCEITLSLVKVHVEKLITASKNIKPLAATVNMCSCSPAAAGYNMCSFVRC